MYDYWPASILEVHDGDTILWRVDMGLDTDRRIWTRLNGVWSPELDEPRGVECRDAVRAQLATADEWRIITYKLRTRQHKEKMTFIRYVADVFNLGMTFCLNEWILENGYGERDE